MSAFVEIEFDNKDGRFPTGQSDSRDTVASSRLRRADLSLLSACSFLFHSLPYRHHIITTPQQASLPSSSAAPSDSRRTSTSSTASQPPKERSCPSSRVQDSAGVTLITLFLKAG